MTVYLRVYFLNHLDQGFQNYVPRNVTDPRGMCRCSVLAFLTLQDTNLLFMSVEHELILALQQATHMQGIKKRWLQTLGGES